MKPLLLILITFSTLTVFAQDTTVNLSNVTIKSVRGDSKTPISQKTVTKKDIEKTYQGQEMTYIISTTPSVNYQSDAGSPFGYTTIRLRGIDQTRINMTLDGISLADQEDEGVYFSNYPDFAINIQSFQIQRGVGTSSFGVSSFGGSINFESQTGLDKGGMVQFGYGAYNAFHFNINNSTGLIKKKFALFTSFSDYKSDGYKYNSASNGYSGFISGEYIINDKNVIKFSGFSGLSINNQAWLAVSESDININPRTNYNDKGETDNFKETFGRLQYIKAFNKDSYITTTFYYSHLDGTWSMFLDETNPINLLHYNLYSNFYGLTSNYHYQANHFKLDLGIDGNEYDRTHSAIIPSESPDKLYHNTGYKDQFSSYLKLQYEIGKLTLFGDIQERYVHFRYKGDTTITPINWNFINPKGGLTYTVSDKVNYYASVGESHREPTRTDMFEGNDNLTVLGSTVPERVIDYELGTNIKLSNLKIQGNLYYMNFKNEITLLGALGSNGLPLMTTVKQSYRSGLELDINYKISQHISLINTSNFSRNYINNAYHPLYTPNIIVNQGIDYNNGGFNIGLTAKYQSKAYISLDNKYDAPEFLIFNGYTSYKYKKFTILGQLNNIENKRYFTNGYVIADEKYYFVNATRSAYVTLKYNW